jgi:acyl-CoA reductase-like NAD-dependent aldehyde dehydrogenase/nicotinamidase-related amidase
MTRVVALLIDMQRDFLDRVLDPPQAELIAACAGWLSHCREQQIPVIHVRTGIDRERDNRPLHWKARGEWRCVVGSAGYQPPAALRPRDDEPVVHKSGWSAFAGTNLNELLNQRGCETVWLAGIHLHACVRASALDAHQLGYRVRIAAQAVGSDDPLHAALTRDYLERRGMVSLAALDEPSAVTTPALTVDPTRAFDPAERRSALLRWGEQLQSAHTRLVDEVVAEIGKPRRYAEAEVRRAVDLVSATLRHDGWLQSAPCGERSHRRYRPVGVVALVTPWNNPVAIPVGKLAPALWYGNAAIWKPSPRARSVSQLVLETLRQAGFDDAQVQLVDGDRRVASTLAADPRIAAVSFTGSESAGWNLAAICARRGIPLQAELGGNNATIVWSGAALEQAIEAVTEAAFGFAGQRCTATRRLIVPSSSRQAVLAALDRAIARCECGAPESSGTRLGPLISVDKRVAIERLVGDHQVLLRGGPFDHPAFHPAVVIAGDDRHSEIVQHESFGPVLVLQPADDFAHALALANGVRQGLVAAMFGGTDAQRAQFVDSAAAGIVKLDQATNDADAEAPFCGWKSSAIGPPEHGDSAREFFTRTQALYR